MIINILEYKNDHIVQLWIFFLSHKKKKKYLNGNKKKCIVKITICFFA